MKELKARILKSNDNYLNKFVGEIVTVNTIDRDGDYMMHGTIDKTGQVLRFYTEQLEPLDVSDVPASHMGSLLLRQIWVFGEARLDAWRRSLPEDLNAYREENGVEWKDERLWNVLRG